MNSTRNTSPISRGVSTGACALLIGAFCNATPSPQIGTLAQEAYIKASNPGEFDVFGTSMAVSGNTLVVGAPREDSNALGVDGDQANDLAVDAGAVYVFIRTGMTWTQQAYLKASNTTNSDHGRFGTAVSISGDTILVGAAGDSSNATGANGDQNNLGAPGSGAAYVFTRTGSVWTQQAYLKASNPGPADAFGTSVSIDGDTAVIGAPNEDSDLSGVNQGPNNNLSDNTGAAYVFERSGSTWTQEAYLKASNPSVRDSFGYSVSASGDTVAVGAWLEDSASPGVNGNQNNGNAQGSGAAYVFVRSGSTWSQEAYVKASNPGAGDNFGYSLSLDGETLAVGAYSEDSDAQGVNGDSMNDDGSDSGAVFVYLRSGSTWTQEAYLKSLNSDAGDLFGVSVQLSGDRLAVTASREDGSAGIFPNNLAEEAGAAYVLTRTESTWSQAAYIKASNTSDYLMLGTAIALSGDVLAVSSHSENSGSSGINGDQQGRPTINGSGAAYAFDLDAPPPPPGHDLCSGDGGFRFFDGCTDCPCSNNAAPGTVGGCLNSAATSARLVASGNTSVSLAPGSTEDLRFALTGAPPLSFCILNSGDSVAPDNTMNPCFGLSSGVQAIQFDGLRCAVGNTRRHGGRSADANGAVGVMTSPWGGEGGPPAGLAQAGGGFAIGQSRAFQVINRDDPLASCMRGLNTSQAVRITFNP